MRGGYWDVLPKRFGKYGLTVHPDKTRLVQFRRPPLRPARKGQPPTDGPGTFDLLGFTHYWSRSRKGNWVVKRKTAANRFTRTVRTVARWCRNHRHRPIGEQHHALCQKLRGHFAYYGITGNSTCAEPVPARRRSDTGGNGWAAARREPALQWASSCNSGTLPAAPPVAIHSVCRVRRKVLLEEPYAVILHGLYGGRSAMTVPTVIVFSCAFRTLDPCRSNPSVDYTTADAFDGGGSMRTGGPTLPRRRFWA